MKYNEEQFFFIKVHSLIVKGASERRAAFQVFWVYFSLLAGSLVFWRPIRLKFLRPGFRAKTVALWQTDKIFTVDQNSRPTCQPAREMKLGHDIY